MYSGMAVPCKDSIREGKINCKEVGNMSDKDYSFRDKVYRLLAELLADQMGGKLVSLEFVDEKKEKIESC